MTDPANTILIADDHGLFRDGLAGLIGRWDEYRLIGAVENGQQARIFVVDWFQISS
jgi:DNA-binding NarL/FixJ family response regulator